VIDWKESIVHYGLFRRGIGGEGRWAEWTFRRKFWNSI